MCVDPRVMSNGVGVPCRKCWQCRENAINDWVGRCIAESEVSVACHSVTLTYGREDGSPDHPRASILTYSDVQKYLKRIRFSGCPCRYFVVGEFGSDKGRCHWHILLFWAAKQPKHVLNERFQEENWPHGYSYWEEVTPAGIRYVCKYIQKDVFVAERQRQIGMSKMPPLGAGYFRGLARRYAQQGLVPRVPEYHFPNVKNKRTGKTQKFRMMGATLDLFLAAYLDEWQRLYSDHEPTSDLVDAYRDRCAPRAQSVRIEPFKRGGGKPWLPPPTAPMWFHEPLNSWVCDHDGHRLFWSFDERGSRAWASVQRTEQQADLLRAAYERRSTSANYRAQSRGR